MQVFKKIFFNFLSKYFMTREHFIFEIFQDGLFIWNISNSKINTLDCFTTINYETTYDRWFQYLLYSSNRSFLLAVGCSHSRANQLYVDSVYNMNSIVAVACPSWTDYQNQNCDMTCTSPMGHDASPRWDRHLLNKILSSE